MDLSGNLIAKDGAAAIAAFLITSPSLRTLNLHDNRLGTFGGIQDIAGALLRSPNRITELRLTSNNIKGGIDNDALEMLGYSMVHYEPSSPRRPYPPRDGRFGATLARLDLGENASA